MKIVGWTMLAMFSVFVIQGIFFAFWWPHVYVRLMQGLGRADGTIFDLLFVVAVNIAWWHYTFKDFGTFVRWLITPRG